MKVPMSHAGFSLILFAVMSQLPSLVAEPIRLHPDNPRWFEWRGKPVALITSAEHYGAVINADFDYARYLATLEADGMNYTRIFSGTYVEPPGAFNIDHNTLAPDPGRFLAPWARSDVEGYAGGGNRFDLDRHNPDYLARLKDFISTADQHGVVVELTLFCSTYSETQWAIHPLNPASNVQALPVEDWKQLHTTDNGEGVMAVQEKLVRWLVRELNGFDNLIYEIQNEPYLDQKQPTGIIVEMKPIGSAGHVASEASLAWQRRIAGIIRETESGLPNRHLIAQNVTNRAAALLESDLLTEADVLNFHYAIPEALRWNPGMPRAFGHDETGFLGQEDAFYRREAWAFIFAGGALFNHLDYSFAVGHEDGSKDLAGSPGGGGSALRAQFAVLSRFLHDFDLAALNPDPDFLLSSPGVLGQVLSVPGKAYALYLRGRGPAALSLALPAGDWSVRWVSVLDGTILREETITGASGATLLTTPDFPGEVALDIRKQPS